MQRMTINEWIEEGGRRFGEDHNKWRFVCPACKHVQAVGDFEQYKDNGATPDSARQECIGRYDGHMHVDMGTGQPCNYAGYGLLCLSPVVVICEDGKEVKSFAFAEAGQDGNQDKD